MTGIYVRLGDLKSVWGHDCDNLGDHPPHATLVHTGVHFPEAKLRDAAERYKLRDRLLSLNIEFKTTAEIEEVKREHEDFTRYYVTVEMNDECTDLWTELQEPFKKGVWADYGKCLPAHTTLGWYRCRIEAARHKQAYESNCATKVYRVPVGMYFDL